MVKGVGSITLLALLALAVTVSASPTIVNKNAIAVLDLSTHVARYSVNVRVANEGKTASSTYTVGVPASLVSNVAYVGAQDAEDNDLSVTKQGNNYQVRIAELKAGASTDLQLEIVFANALSPLPKEIGQQDDQKLVFEGNLYFQSPYRTDSQKLEIRLANGKVLSKTEVKPMSDKGSTIIYGPFKGIGANQDAPLRVHFENNSPQFTMLQSLKEVWVSSSGDVQVEEHYEVKHTGAGLKGLFSRIDYQAKHMQASPAAIKQIRASLPPSINNAYYRDQIGNISTSRIVGTRSETILDLVPRFPLFGGWKTEFYMGYYTEAGNLVKPTGSRLRVNVSLGCSFDECVAKDHTVRIILPVGASDVVTQPLPFEVETWTESEPAFASLAGRKVVVVKLPLTVSEHNVPLVVEYSLSSLMRTRDTWLTLCVGAVLVSLFAAFNTLSASVSPVQAAQHSAQLARLAVVKAVHSLPSKPSTQELKAAEQAALGMAKAGKALASVKCASKSLADKVANQSKKDLEISGMVTADKLASDSSRADVLKRLVKHCKECEA